MIFQLEWVTHDQTVSHHFRAPEGQTFEQFKALCDRLMNEAAENALAGKCRSPGHEKLLPCWLGYDYCVEEVAHMLPDYGYEEVEFPVARYTHGSGFMIENADPEDEPLVYTSELREKIVAHNKRMLKGPWPA